MTFDLHIAYRGADRASQLENGRSLAHSKLGGSLIINAAQDKAFFADPAFSGVMASDKWLQEGEMHVRKLDEVKGQIVATSAAGVPLIVKNAYGKGNVIFMTPQFPAQ